MCAGELRVVKDRGANPGGAAQKGDGHNSHFSQTKCCSSWYFLDCRFDARLSAAGLEWVRRGVRQRQEGTRTFHGLARGESAASARSLVLNQSWHEQSGARDAFASRSRLSAAAVTRLQGLFSRSAATKGSDEEHNCEKDDSLPLSLAWRLHAGLVWNTARPLSNQPSMQRVRQGSTFGPAHRNTKHAVTRRESRQHAA
eukprot:scaffold1861_cov312-Pinguiococcus_pyrenoidosus.AAC.7